MDTGNGNFIELIKEKNSGSTDSGQKKLEDQYPNHGGWFHIGQLVEVEGSLFRVKSVKPTELRLKLLRRIK